MDRIIKCRIRRLLGKSLRNLLVLMLTVLMLASIGLADETGSDILTGTDSSTESGQTINSGESDGSEVITEIVDGNDSGETSEDQANRPVRKKPKKRDRKWHYGTWKNDCYYNGSGVKLGSMNAMMKKKLPKLKNLTSSQKILVIGASRVLGMKGALKDSKVFFYPCGGSKINWFFEKVRKNNGVRQPALLVIRAFLKAQPRGKVIIDMGGNDLSNIDAYVGLYRSLQNHFPKAKFYFMGILPRAKGDSSNPARKKFNQRLTAEFSDKAIDLYDRVYKLKSFRTKDGIHYYKKQIRTYYKWMMKKIGRKVKVNQKTGKVKG